MDAASAPECYRRDPLATNPFAIQVNNDGDNGNNNSGNNNNSNNNDNNDGISEHGSDYDVIDEKIDIEMETKGNGNGNGNGISGQDWNKIFAMQDHNDSNNNNNNNNRNENVAIIIITVCLQSLFNNNILITNEFGQLLIFTTDSRQFEWIINMSNGISKAIMNHIGNKINFGSNFVKFSNTFIINIIAEKNNKLKKVTPCVVFFVVFFCFLD